MNHSFNDEPFIFVIFVQVDLFLQWPDRFWNVERNSWWHRSYFPECILEVHLRHVLDIGSKENTYFQNG